MLSFTAVAKMDRLTSEGYLGEKRLDSYAGTYQPLIFHDIYRGKLSFADDLFFDHYMSRYLLPEDKEYSDFLNSELNSGLSCPNESLSRYFDEIRYAYRLVTLSYLLEGQWHLKTVSDHFQLRRGCRFDLAKWLATCKPKSTEMKTFISRLEAYQPRYLEPMPKDYSLSDWQKELSQKKLKWYSHYRLAQDCKEGCGKEEIESHLSRSCESDEAMMTLVCSEQDELYGLSAFRDAYYLLGQSHIINTFNKNGEAMGCLRRFSEVMSHKEVKYPVLKNLFPSLQSYLNQKYQERFIQGRVFFYGASKEFEEKGVKNIFVKDQPFKVAAPPPEVLEKVKTPEPIAILPPPIMIILPAKKVELPPETKAEIRLPLKSAFLQAAEVRKAQDLDRVDVDMLKLKYDYVFTLNMINNLTEKMQTFMTREALKEMMMYDKLGTKEGPVPLLFLKYMIDMEEHQGLFNLVSILGNRFYVSNELDGSFTPVPEMIQLTNQEMGSKNWLISIIKP